MANGVQRQSNPKKNTVQPVAQSAQQQATIPTNSKIAQIGEAVQPKKSIFKKWWFWLIVVIVLGLIATGIFMYLP